MITDLPSPLFAPATAPGTTAQVAIGAGMAIAASAGKDALIGTSSAAVALAGPPVNPALTTAMAFQAALASQTPIERSVQIKLAPFASSTITNLVSDPASPSGPALAQRPSTPQVTRLALAPSSVMQPVTPPTTLALSIPLSGRITLFPMPALAGPISGLAAFAPIAADAATVAPATEPTAKFIVTPDTSGKLPNTGNILPVDPAVAKPAVLSRVSVAVPRQDAPDKTADDDPADAIIAPDPAVSPPLALFAAIAPLPPLTMARVTDGSTRPAPVAAPAAASIVPARQIIGTGFPSPTATGTVMPTLLPASAAIAVPAAPTGLSALMPTSAVPQTAPLIAAMPSPIIIAVPALLLAQIAPVIAAQPAREPVASGADVTEQPAAAVPATPALVTGVPASLTPTSPPVAQSTASRLARQPGAARVATVDPRTDDGTTAPPSAMSALPVAQNPASAATSTNSPVTTPPPDFAALVDRLLEARATAQSAAPPQQISTSVAHADFGKVSLTFQQDPAGLSVSMTSADPEFARAAQSAIASAPAAVVHAVAADRSISGAPASQGFTQADAPAPVVAGPTGQSAGFSTTGGGSQQSQAKAQPQQPPGIIAANRAPAVGANAGTTAATGAGIFA